MSFYEILGITKNATDEDIKKAYRTNAKKHHPDANLDDPKAADRFKEIQEAYDTLIDPSKRAMYDGGQSPRMQFRRKSKKSDAPQPEYSFETVTEEFFGGSSFRGRNIAVRIEIEFNQIRTGCTKHIKVKKRKICTGCQGLGTTGYKQCANCNGKGATSKENSFYDAPFEILTPCNICKGLGKVSVTKCGDCIGSGFLPGWYEKPLTVTIPPGIDNGAQLRLAGEGEDSMRLGRPGDVMVFVLVKEHPILTRDGPNLLVEVPVSYTQLVLGDEIEIPTLSETVKVKVPPGSQSHTKFRLRGKGVPNGNGGLGDLIATLKIETPKIIDEEYKKTFEVLSNLEKKNITPRREEWNRKISKDNK